MRNQKHGRRPVDRNVMGFCAVYCALALGGFGYWTSSVHAQAASDFTIKDSTSGNPLGSFTSEGNLVMYSGTVHAEASSAELTPGNGGEFIVKSAAGSTLLLLRRSGELYAAGKLYTDACGFTEPPLALKVKSGGVTVSYVTGADYEDSVLEPESPHVVPAGSVVLTGTVLYPEELSFLDAGGLSLAIAAKQRLASTG